MTCTLCGRETDKGHWCILSGCDQWIGDCCADGCAMCDKHFEQTRKAAGV
jgi:hypothetical protein